MVRFSFEKFCEDFCGRTSLRSYCSGYGLTHDSGVEAFGDLGLVKRPRKLDLWFHGLNPQARLLPRSFAKKTCLSETLAECMRPPIEKQNSKMQTTKTSQTNNGIIQKEHIKADQLATFPPSRRPFGPLPAYDGQRRQGREDLPHLCWAGPEDLRGHRGEQRDLAGLRKSVYTRADISVCVCVRVLCT